MEYEVIILAEEAGGKCLEVHGWGASIDEAVDRARSVLGHALQSTKDRD